MKYPPRKIRELHWKYYFGPHGVPKYNEAHYSVMWGILVTAIQSIDDQDTVLVSYLHAYRKAIDEANSFTLLEKIIYDIEYDY